MGQEFQVVGLGKWLSLEISSEHNCVFSVGPTHLAMLLRRILELPLQSRLLISHQTPTTLAHTLELDRGDVEELGAT